MAFLLLSIPLAGESKMIQELENAGHALLFGALSLVFLRDRKSGPKPYLAAGLVVLALGAASELMQWLEGRDAELLDVVRDGLGAASFLGFAWTLNHPVVHSRRVLMHLGAIVAILAVFSPPILTGAALAHRWYVFPVLADFDSGIESRLWSAGKAQFERVPAPWDSQKPAVRVTFEPARYSGFSISGPWPDWSGHESLSFVVFSEQPQPVTLNLRIHDASHNNDFFDRFNAELSIKPGLNRVTVPIQVIHKAPKGRRMDLGKIQSLGLFIVQPLKHSVLFLADFTL